MFRKFKIIYDKVTEGNNGGGGSGYESTTQKSTIPAPDSTIPKTEGDSKFDNFGYPIEQTPEATPNKTGESTQKSEQKTEPKTDPQETKVDPASGYVEPPKEDVKSVEKKEEPKKEETKPVEGELQLEFGFLADADKKALGEFAKANNLSKEQAQALVELRKTELTTQKEAIANFEKQQQEEVKNVRSKWYNELKDDKEFGGEKFGANVHKVDKFLNDFMPETKKTLTERKSMLPPYVMRDLLKIANKVHETENFVQGNDATKTDSSDSQFGFLDDLYK